MKPPIISIESAFRNHGFFTFKSAEEQDGYRVLIDRLWPRGLSKDKADIDEWDKQLAPSTELRKWFGHQPELFPAFTEKYIGELEHNDEAQGFMDKCKTLLSQGNVTLLLAVLS